MFKRVHFAPTNRIYSPGSATPSPTFTASSISSSSPGIPTPPPEDDDEYQHTIYPRTPFSAAMDLYPEYQDVVVPKPMQIHFLLAYAPNTEPAFDYDLVHPPTNGDGKYPILAFSEYATSPPMDSLVITHPLLKFDIEVNSSSGPVTVADVLISIYRHLRLAIHPVEYAELPDGERREGVDAAYYVRCGTIRNPDERLMEERKGIKKIDLLMGCTRFMGLSGTLEGPEVWELNVA